MTEILCIVFIIVYFLMMSETRQIGLYLELKVLALIRRPTMFLFCSIVPACPAYCHKCKYSSSLDTMVCEDDQCYEEYGFNSDTGSCTRESSSNLEHSLNCINSDD